MNSKCKLLLLSTEWVDYVEEPMKYQALRPTFSPWWVVGGLMGWVGGVLIRGGWGCGWLVVWWGMGGWWCGGGTWVVVWGMGGGGVVGWW